MFNHQPTSYECPFCELAAGRDNGVNAPSDIVFRDDDAMVLIAPRWWPNSHAGRLREHFKI